MTNINCTKPCQYQNDGKCSCDSIMTPFLDPQAVGGPDCPYQCKPKEFIYDNSHEH